MLSRRIAYRIHALVYEYKQLRWSLNQDGIEVKLMWIPSQARLMRNDEWTRQAALESFIFHIPLSSSDFQSLVKPPLEMPVGFSILFFQM
jgi:hypothetical protein